MSKLPMVNFKTMDKILHHGNMDIARPLMREILREISVSPDEYVELLKKI